MFQHRPEQLRRIRGQDISIGRALAHNGEDEDRGKAPKQSGEGEPMKKTGTADG